MREMLSITKALSDPNRLRTLMFLAQGELCVCQIIAMLGLAPSTVSKHMSVLHQAGLVEARKEGRWIYYRLPGQAAPARIHRTLKWLGDCLRDDAQVRRDARRLESLVRQARRKLCACYR